MKQVSLRQESEDLKHKTVFIKCFLLNSGSQLIRLRGCLSMCASEKHDNDLKACTAFKKHTSIDLCDLLVDTLSHKDTNKRQIMSLHVEISGK